MIHKLLDSMDPRSFQLLSGLIVLASAIMIFTFLLMPEFKEYRTVSGNWNLLDSSRKTEQDVMLKINKVRSDLVSAQKQLHGNVMNIPDDKMEGYIIGMLQKISWDNNIEIQGVNPAVGKKIGVFQEYKFDILLRGSYFNLYAWLRQIRNELGFIVVRKYELEKMITQNNKDSEMLNMKLTTVSYKALEH